MPPVILTLLQGLFLLLLYVFVARAVRAVLRDVAALGPGRTPSRVRPGGKLGGRPGKSGVRGGGVTPARNVVPRELVVHLLEGSPRVIPLNNAPVTLGRSPDCTVPLDDPYASDQHARVYRDGEQWLLIDDGSTNGTYLNQQKVTGPMTLSAGDQMSVGKTVVEVRK